MLSKTTGNALAAILSVALLAAPRPAQAAPIKDYVALGDSMAFGETTFTQNPSNGDRGYVGLYANSLATQNGGVRPNVINLGVDAETSSTFFNGGPKGDGTSSGSPAPQLNLNYANPAPTQNSLLLSTIALEKAAGHDISTVSVQLGANDLYAAANAPGFFALSPAAQGAQIAKVLAGVQANDATLLTELKTLLPHANLVLLGYHNPFNADPTSAIGKVADPAIKALNTLIAAEAKAFGGRYVDTYSPFLGHEIGLTSIALGNVHPNAAGYQAIANQLETVPEPGSLLVFGAGVAGWLALSRRRLRSRAA